MIVTSRNPVGLITDWETISWLIQDKSLLPKVNQCSFISHAVQPNWSTSLPLVMGNTRHESSSTCMKWSHYRCDEKSVVMSTSNTLEEQIHILLYKKSSSKSSFCWHLQLIWKCCWRIDYWEISIAKISSSFFLCLVFIFVFCCFFFFLHGSKPDIVSEIVQTVGVRLKQHSTRFLQEIAGNGEKKSLK